jgi:putative two-component system response regulator
VNVLLVDDDAINLRLYRQILHTIPGLTLHEYTNSTQALAWSASNVADLAIVDFSMPEPDGLQFIERFRRIPGNASSAIVMVTSASELSVRYRALELGAEDFLLKPVDPLELVARARNLLALADARRKLADRSAWLAAEVLDATKSLRERERETINRLTLAAEFRDNETGMHIVRIGYFCELIGRAAGLSAADLEMLLLASPMHDVGKVSTPDAILLKPGKLGPEEWDVMKRHTTAGFDILKDSESPLLQHAAEIALGHHEKFDGTGYPYGRAGAAIPLYARICAISDVFDALTSVRHYKAAWPFEEAERYVIARSGSQFDPSLVQAFQSALPEIVAAKLAYADREVAAV